MKRAVIASVLAFVLGSGLSAAASGMLTETVIKWSGCDGIAGYVTMSADFRSIGICTSDGMFHWLEAR